MTRDLLRVLTALEAALGRGTTVLLFPEGTTTNGQKILAFRSGLFEAAVRVNVPVVPVAITVSTTDDARWGASARADITLRRKCSCEAELATDRKL